MATSRDMKFSVVLEAITAAFNKGITDAKTNYKQATDGIVTDANKTGSATEAVSAKLKDVFKATDASGIVNAFKAATTELNNTKQGATLASNELKLVGAAGKAAVGELNGALKTAQAELRVLQLSKATPADLENAQKKVVQLKQDVANASAEYGRFQTAASQAMRRAAADTQTAGEQAKAAGNAIYNSLNIKSGGTLRTEIAAITRELTTFKANSGAPAAEVDRVTSAAAAKIKELKSELGGITPSSASAVTSIKGLATAFAGFAGIAIGLDKIKDAIAGILDTTMKFEAVNKQLLFASGSAEQAGKDFEYVKGVAKAMGLELLSSAAGFAKLAASTKGTRLEGQGTRTLFEGITAAAATMGLTVDDTNGVILALSQVMGKGKVSMEELRGQLGERLTPAMEIAAKSMGVTKVELEKLVDAGLDATAFMEKFGPALLQTFGPTAGNNVKTLAGQLNLLKNQFTELQIQLGSGDNALGGAAITVLKDIGAAVESLRSNLSSIDPSVLDGVQQAFRQLYDLVTQLGTGVIGAFSEVFTAVGTLSDLITGVIASFTGFGDQSEQVGLVTRALQGLSVIMGLLQDGVKGIGILFTVTTGVVQSFFSAIAFGLSKVTFGDLSKSLQDLSFTLQNSAQASFARAGQAAEAFGSSAVAAADKAVGAHTQAAATIQTVHVAAAGAAAAAQTAIGVAASKVGDIIELSTLKGEKATLTVATAGHEAEDAFKSLGKAAGVELPVMARTAEQLGLVMGEVAAKSKLLATNIGKELPEAIAKLNGPDLVKFQDSFINGMVRAGASTDSVKTAIAEFASQAVKSLGGDIGPSIGRISSQFADQQVVLKALIQDIGNLKIAGVDTGGAISAALEGMLAKTRNPVEIQALIGYFTSLGAQGVITGRQMADGLQQAKDKLDQVTPGVNTLTEAFKLFGLTTREESARVATDYQTAFDKIQQSGRATTEQLRAAFTTYAQAAIAANGGVYSGFLDSKAAALGLKIEVDSLGRTVITAMDSGTPAINRASDAMRGFGGATRGATGDIDSQAASLRVLIALKEKYSAPTANKDKVSQENPYGLTSDGLKANKDGSAAGTFSNTLPVDAAFKLWEASKTGQLGQVSLEDAKAAYKQAENSLLYMQAATRDSPGANSFEYTKSTTDLYNAARAALEKVQAREDNASGKLAQPVRKAAAEALKTQAAVDSGATKVQNSNSGASGKATDSTTITFIGADGKKATVNTTADTTAQNVIDLLRKAGATAIQQG